MEVGMPKCEKCFNVFPNRVEVDGVIKVLNSRKYCLECSPFGVHNTKKINGKQRKDQREYKCACGEVDPAKFYGNKRTVCGKCHNIYTLKVGQEKRYKAIQYLGGECKICGYKRYFGSIDIHHMDPTIKDDKFHNLRCWSWKRIEKEIQSCIALCKNCHSEVHTGGLIIV